jgi:hypothetical protein
MYAKVMSELAIMWNLCILYEIYELAAILMSHLFRSLSQLSLDQLQVYQVSKRSY